MTSRAGSTSTSRKLWGFTLIEVILVAFLLGLASSLVLAVNYRFSDTLAAKNAAREIYAFLGAARGLAILEGFDDVVTYDPATRTLSEEIRGKSVSLPEKARLIPAEGDAVEVASKEEAYELARFYADGSAQTLKVRVTAGDSTLEVSVDPILGTVRVEGM